MKNLGSNIKNRRIKLNMKQKELGIASGLSQGTIASIEAGKSSPRIDQLCFIANALNYPLIDLLLQSVDKDKCEDAYENFFQHLKLYLYQKNVNQNSINQTIQHVTDAYLSF